MHKNHFLVDEQTAQKNVVGFLSDIYVIRSFTYTHTKETSDTADSFFHTLERNLEGLKNFRNLCVGSNSLPELLELALWDYVRFHVVTDSNTRIINSVFFLVRTLLLLSININLSDGEHKTLLDLVDNRISLLAVLSI